MVSAAATVVIALADNNRNGGAGNSGGNKGKCGNNNQSKHSRGKGKNGGHGGDDGCGGIGGGKHFVFVWIIVIPICNFLPNRKKQEKNLSTRLNSMQNLPT